MCYISMDVCVDMYVVPSLRRVMNGIGGWGHSTCSVLKSFGVSFLNSVLVNRWW